MPWRNGGGITHEVAVHPEGAGLDAFGWRISMAEVRADGPFSRFHGIDRSLILLEGAGLALRFADGREVVVDGGEPFAFDGEAEVSGRLLAGPVIDLNVMTRRGRWLQSTRSLRIRGRRRLDPSGVAAIVCRSGALALAGRGMSLGPKDCLLLADGGGSLTVEGDGDAVLVELRDLRGPED